MANIPPVPSVFKDPVTKQFLEALRRNSSSVVSISGGDLTNIVCESIKITNLQGHPDSLLLVDALGNVGFSPDSISGINSNLQDLQGQIDNLEDIIEVNNTYLASIRGIEEIEICDSEVVITHGKSLQNYSPTVSLIVPSSNDVLFIAGIKDITATTFTIILSGEVPSSGYKVSWAISSNEILPSLSFEDLTNTPNDISSDNGKFLKVFDNAIVTSDISEIYYYNKVELTVGQTVHEIVDGYITESSEIICSIKAPLESMIFSHNIIEVKNGSFKVELSGEIYKEGYFLTYSVFK